MLTKEFLTKSVMAHEKLMWVLTFEFVNQSEYLNILLNLLICPCSFVFFSFLSKFGRKKEEMSSGFEYVIIDLYVKCSYLSLFMPQTCGQKLVLVQT